MTSLKYAAAAAVGLAALAGNADAAFVQFFGGSCPADTRVTNINQLTFTSATVMPTNTCISNLNGGYMMVACPTRNDPNMNIIMFDDPACTQNSQMLMQFPDITGCIDTNPQTFGFAACDFPMDLPLFVALAKHAVVPADPNAPTDCADGSMAGSTAVSQMVFDQGAAIPDCPTADGTTQANLVCDSNGNGLLTFCDGQAQVGAKLTPNLRCGTSNDLAKVTAAFPTTYSLKCFN